jgi:hypothetical protein
MGADLVEGSPSPAVSGSHSWTADGIWPSGVQHAVEYRYIDGRFRALDGQAACAQAGTDDGLVAAHRRFDKRTLAVTRFLLSAQQSFRRHHGDVPVPLGGMMVGGGARYRSRMRRNDDRDVARARGHCIVAAIHRPGCIWRCVCWARFGILSESGLST